MESCTEIKNKKSVVFVIYINVADDVLFQEHCLLIWIILFGFRDTNDFGNLDICKHKMKFTCRGYCRFTLSDCQNAFSSLCEVFSSAEEVTLPIVRDMEACSGQNNLFPLLYIEIILMIV